MRNGEPAAGGDTPAPHVAFADKRRPLFWIALAFCAFQIVTAAYSPISSQIVRAVHVGFLLFLVYGIAAEEVSRRWRKALLWLAGGVAFGLSLYHWVFEAELILRAGNPSLIDGAVGVVTLVLLFEASRRMLGLALPILCLLFLGYCLLGHVLPSPLSHRGYDVSQVIDQFAFGTEGIYGIPTYVSSSYIFLFILFGSFLEQAGMIRLFTDLALGSVGHTKGGAAKVAVISSGLMGTINGSGVANVVTTGQFTIPLMKRFGYRPAFAGAVEATSSMGGQIMPPVMGAVAFIMAETLNISYAEVCVAAVVPALLYFLTAFWMVHLEAGRRGLHGLPKDQCPNALAALKRQGHLLLPLAALVFLLFSGYTPLFSGIVGLSLTVVLILGATVSAVLGPVALRAAFWVILGGLCGLFFEYGVNVLAALIGILILANLILKGGRETLGIAVRGLIDGARHALPVGIACALVGIIIGTMTLTGLAGVITQAILAFGRDSMFLSLVLTMLVCLVLGMGIPTIPNYIIVSSLVGPVLLKLGVPLIVSHMFVFYFGIMADLTPPVALAVLAATAIARSSFWATGIEAVRVAIAGFVVPYMAVYDHALMLQTDDPLAVAYIVGKAVLAIGLWGAAAIGHFTRPLAPWERLLAAVAAFSLVVANPTSDLVGLALTALFAAVQWRRQAKAAASR
jgi:TRAP transporter 4TM/12TM fusion protein